MRCLEKLYEKSLDKEAYPYFEQWEKDRDIPRDFWLKLGENGFLCPMVSEEYGGLRSILAILLY